MKKLRGVIGRAVFIGLFIFGLEAVPLLQIAHAATTPLAVDGSQRYQTIDGFGTNINSASWKNGQLKPALDTLMDAGANTWRVVLDNTDWEATNDNTDPNVYDWNYYNTVYSSAKFQDLWSTIGYINQQQPNAHIILNFMGPGPAWMGGDRLTTTDANKNEWVEMISSAAYYGRVTAGVHFDILSPANEPDGDCVTGHEGMCIAPDVYADIMSRLATKLDAVGLTDLRLMGPDTVGVNLAVINYYPQMMAKPNLMAKLDHLGMHDYDGNTGNADSAIKSSAYPTKNFWMDEVGQFADAFSEVGQNAAAITTWDGFDSVYNHPLLRNGSTTAPNDAGDAPAMLAYDSATGTYTPRKEYYQFKQLFKYVPQGSVRVATTESVSGVTAYTFLDAASGRVTIVGNNTGSAVDFAGSLGNIATSVPRFELYTTGNSGGANFTRGSDVTVTNGAFNFTAPSNSIFTLTYAGTPDTTPPTQPTNLHANGTPAANQVDLAWDASTDAAGIANYAVKRSVGNVPNNPVTLSNAIAGTSFSDTTAAANTTYTYTVSAADYSGNASSDSAPLTVTTAAASPFALKSTVTTHQTSAASTITSTSFSAGAGNLAVAFLSSDGPSGSITFNTPTTSGLTWTLRKRVNATGSGTAEIWTAVVPAGFSSGTLNAARSSGSYQGSVTIAVFSGADTSIAPATGGASGTSSAPSASITAARAGSYVWAVGNDWSSVASRTAGNNQTVVDQYLPSGIGAFWVQRLNSVTSAPGAVTVNDTAPTTGDKWNLAAIEIAPQAAADSQAPGAPTNLAATNVGVTGLTLGWDKPGDNVGVTGYEIWRSDLAQPLATITSGDTLSYADTNLQPNTAYHYAVKAKDAAGNVSAASATLDVSTQADVQAPTAPNATLQTATTNSATLSWNASTDNVGVAGYEVWRGDSADSQTLLVSSSPLTATAFTDTNLQASTTYYYKVRALDASGNGADSLVITAVTADPDSTPPTAPVVTATATSFARAHLSWTAAADANGLQPYTVQRDGQTIGTTAATSFDDSGLAAGQTYTYTIIARDTAGNAASGSANVTLPTVALTAPANGATVSGTVALSVNTVTGVAGVQFLVDGANSGAEDTTSPYGINLDTTTLANGTHTISARARDANGSTTTTTAVTVTVGNAAPSLALDASVSTNQTSAGSSITSGSITTTKQNDLLVAFINSDGPSSGAQTFKTVTGGGLTWTLRQRTNTRAGTSEIWTAVAPNILTNLTVTATRNSGSYLGSITVAAFSGASTAIGAVAGANGASGAPSVNLTTTKAGSLVWAVGNDWDGATARTVGSGQTMVNQYLASAGDTFWVQRLTNAVANAGTTVTINDTAPTNHRWNLAAIEIIPQ